MAGWRILFMKNTHRKKKPVSAESIARMADKGKDVSRFFTNSGEMRKPIQRVNVDFTASMLEELEGESFPHQGKTLLAFIFRFLCPPAFPFHGFAEELVDPGLDPRPWRLSHASTSASTRIVTGVLIGR